MLGRRLSSLRKSSPKPQISSSMRMRNGGEEKSTSLGRKAVHLVLFTITGGVALSALDDLSIYHSCSSKAMEKVSKNKAIVDALGDPIVKGPWYNASIAVAHKKHSVSCSFPLSGPQGTGLLQLKAVRNGDDTWFSYFLPRDWDILIMDALLHLPGNEEKHQTLRINLSNKLPPPCAACTATECKPGPSVNSEAKLSAKQ